MLISGNNRSSRISTCLDAAHHFLLSREEAVTIVESQLLTIGKQWPTVCEFAQISPIDRALLRRYQFLNLYAFDDLQGKDSHLMKLASDIRTYLS